MDNTQENRYITIAIILTSFASPLLFGSLNIALPTIAKELAMNAVQMTWVTSVFALTSAILILPFGRLADISGRKKMFILGLAIYTSAMTVTAFSISGYMLIALTLVQGIGFSMVVTSSTAIVSSAYPPQQRGRIFGMTASAVYLGTSMGPTIGGLLTHNFGWRTIYIPTFVLFIPVAVLLLTKIKSEWADAKGEKFDIIGSVLLSITLFCILYGFSSLPKQTGIVIIIIGVIAAIVFILWELKVKNPLFDIGLITRNRLFAFGSFTHLIYYTATFAITFIMSLYLQYIKGFTSQEAGFILLITPFVMAVFSPIAGRISDRVQPRINVSFAIVIVLVGILFLWYATVNQGLINIIVALVLVGLGSAFFTSPNTNAIMNSVERRHYGVASATQAATRNIGITFSMSLIILLFSLFIGNVAITPEYYPSFMQSIRIAFIAFAGLCICGTITSFTRGRIVTQP